MNYLKQILALNELQLITPLSQGQFMLYHALLDVNNKCFWKEWFEVANSRLEAYTALTRQSISKARNELKQKGLIDFKTNGKKATSYKIIQLYSEKKEECQPTCQINRQAGLQDDLQDSLQQVDKLVDNKLTSDLQDGCTLIKQNKTKLNNISSSASISYLESDCVTDVGDDMLPPVLGQKVLDFYQDNFGGILNPLMVQTIQDLAKTYGDDLAVEAFKRSVEAKRPVSYAKRILKDWNTQGVKTPKDIEALDVAFEREKKQSGKKNYKRESYKENTPEWLKEQQEERKKATSAVQANQSSVASLKARIEALSVKGDGNTES